MAVAISNHCPNTLRRWIIRNVIRNIFDLARSKRAKTDEPGLQARQVPPSEYGQSELPDAYEESLKELTAPPRK